MLMDLKFSMRALRRQPTYSAVAIATLALGIGATAAIFSIVNAVLIQPLPYDEPERLFALRSLDSNGLPAGLMAPRYAEPLFAGHPSVEAAAIGWVQAGSIIATDGTAYPFMPHRVTSRFFDVFSGAISVGRGFEPNEPEESIVVSHSAWEKYLGSNPKVIGASVVVDGSQRTVIGVTRRGFSFPEGAESWQSFETTPDVGGVGDLPNFQAYLRLRPGIPWERFEAELTALSNQLGPNKETGRPFVYVLRPLLEDVVGDLGPTVLILSGATGILLLIACLNVANLLLSRANARSHEIGLREAIGASRLRILRQLMSESLVMCTIGGAIGVALAYAGVRLLLGIGPAKLPRLGSVSLDGNVLVFSAGVVLVTALLVGFAPAAKLSRTRLRGLADRSGRGGSAGRAENRVFAALVVAEVALAVVLASGAGLLLHSYVNLAQTDNSVESEGVLWMRLVASHIEPEVEIVEGPDGTIRNVAAGYRPINDFYGQLKDRIRGIPGVTEVTDTQVIPLVRNPTEAANEPFTIVGRPTEKATVRIRPVGADFFSVMGVPIVAGRHLQPTDRRGAPGVALVNEAFARQYFGGEDAIGRRLGFSDTFQITGRGYGFGERIYDEVEIVGVVPDIRFLDMAQPAVPNVYMSTEQFTPRLRVLVVRTELEDPASLIPTIRRDAAAMAPTVPVEFGVYRDSIDSSIARQRLGMALLVVFGSIAFVLAAVGVYGVMAYSVAQRTREIALRSALGANSGQVLGQILRRGAAMGCIGVMLGVVGTVALRSVVQSQLHEISALDLTVMIPVPLALFGVALLASFLPARRASRIDPAVMLRME